MAEKNSAMSQGAEDTPLLRCFYVSSVTPFVEKFAAFPPFFLLSFSPAGAVLALKLKEQ